MFQKQAARQRLSNLRISIFGFHLMKAAATTMTMWLLSHSFILFFFFIVLQHHQPPMLVQANEWPRIEYSHSNNSIASILGRNWPRLDFYDYEWMKMLNLKICSRVWVWTFPRLFFNRRFDEFFGEGGGGSCRIFRNHKRGYFRSLAISGWFVFCALALAIHHKDEEFIISVGLFVQASWLTHVFPFFFFFWPLQSRQATKLDQAVSFSSTAVLCWAMFHRECDGSTAIVLHRASSMLSRCLCSQRVQSIWIWSVHSFFHPVQLFVGSFIHLFVRVSRAFEVIMDGWMAYLLARAIGYLFIGHNKLKSTCGRSNGCSIVCFQWMLTFIHVQWKSVRK